MRIQAQYRSVLKRDVCRGKWRWRAQGDLVLDGKKNRWTDELNKFLTKVLELARVWRAARGEFPKRREVRSNPVLRSDIGAGPNDKELINIL